ncbi:uncharacterized protein LOC135390560 isoform X3 [Ornithodoros turicata]|uniref:uncharacterized protein LOC135390560 isoform X3 n=1 Tax=Ornithodoros turicata TaxID=34597 RepID=UPI003138792E
MTSGSPSRNVQALRNLFVEKNPPAVLRIPRPVIAPKPSRVFPSNTTNVQGGTHNPQQSLNSGLCKETQVRCLAEPPETPSRTNGAKEDAAPEPLTAILKKYDANFESETTRNDRNSRSISSSESCRQDSLVLTTPCSRQATRQVWDAQISPNCLSENMKHGDNSESYLVTSSDNYVCNSGSQRWRKKELPSLLELGPPPSKPPRPINLVPPGAESIHPPPRTKRPNHHSVPAHSLVQEDQELYGDTIVPDESSSPIPEYTEDEEYQLYADTVPPAVPDSKRPGVETILVQKLDGDSTQCEEMYQEMPCSEVAWTEEEGRKKREYGKLASKTQRKFGMTGLEEPVDTGLVKCSCRGGRLDLSVKKGENLYILRMENNPPGKWLVRNSKGQVGYAQVTNIEVDADSIRVDVQEEDTDEHYHWLAKLTMCVR